MSLKKSTVQGKTTTLLNFSDLKKGMKVAGVVKSVKSYGLIIKLDGSNVSGLCHTSELSDKPVTDITKLYTVGDVVKAIILKKNDEKHKLSLGLKASYFTAEDLDDEDEAMAESDEDIIDNSNNEEDEEMEDAENSDDDDESEEEEDSDVEIEDASVGENKVDLFAGVDEIEPLEFNQDDDNDSFADTDSENEKQSASSDSESDGEKNTTSSKKKSRRQKQALKKAEEERIQKLEAKIVNNEQQELPTSATDFDKLMLSSPNSSYLWIQFMAFQLQMAEIEKARAVAERAINTISFREEAEKKNVWVAYLNLENMYGTQETLKSVFDRAVQYNEPRDMYHSLARIYERTGKFEAVEELYKVMMKKFRDSPQVWTTVGLYYITHRKEEMARQILNRSLEALPKYEHVETITKFAQMEFKFGDPERGRTIFEGLVTNHPTKLNIWNVYLDMEMKVGNVDVVRRLFERAITLKFSSKKMKSLFKKYLMFEKTKGTPEGESHVKKLAIEYVNRVTN
ncbi:rRNA biogenesis protein rrp5 [Nowakowskiella sp. JEL0407]|nr:rRNA biogenesis protein rrp5 [Nowakowskiella sp. JEL0407]